MRVIEVAIGSGGVSPCASCAPLLEPVPRDAAVIADEIVQAGADAPAATLLLAGSEPFRHPALPMLIGTAREAGFRAIRLRTDATEVALGENARGVVYAGVRQLEVVLLGGDAPTHDAHAGTPGAFDAALAGIRAFLAAAAEQGCAVAVSGAVPVCSHTRDHLPAIVGAFAGAGAVSVALEVGVPSTRPGGLDRWLGAAISTGTVNGVWTHVRGLAPAGLPADPLHAISPLTLEAEVGA